MRYVFADCELDMELRVLRRDARQRTLRPKPLQVLLYLIEHCDRVVSKQEMAEHAWPEEYISDAVIQNSIMAVRQAVGDSGREQRIIQTVHGYGYRFIAAVTTCVTETERDTGHAEQHEATAPPMASHPLTSPAEETASIESSSASPSSTPHTASSRRQLTVLFCDLVDSTHLASQLGIAPK